jgi:hypothetical protein
MSTWSINYTRLSTGNGMSPASSFLASNFSLSVGKQLLQSETAPAYFYTLNNNRFEGI